MHWIEILRALFTLQLLILSTGTHFQPRIPTYLGSRGLKSLRDLNLCVFIRMGDLFFRQSAAFWAKITSNGQHRLPLLTIFSRDFSWVTHTDVFIRCWTFIFKQSYMRDWTSLAEIVPNVRCMRFFFPKTASFEGYKSYYNRRNFVFAHCAEALTIRAIVKAVKINLLH